METSGFYSLDESTNSLIYGPNYVINAKFELRKENKNEYQYPYFGWYWFDTRAEALNHFEIIEEPINEPTTFLHLP